jgi:hypothetical protein
MGIIDEFDDVIRPAHDDDETRRLLEKPRLARGWLPPRRFQQILSPLAAARYADGLKYQQSATQRTPPGSIGSF